MTEPAFAGNCCLAAAPASFAVPLLKQLGLSGYDPDQIIPPEPGTNPPSHCQRERCQWFYLWVGGES